jgi:hypothetical protein
VFLLLLPNIVDASFQNGPKKAAATSVDVAISVIGKTKINKLRIDQQSIGKSLIKLKW